jgi:hypothetical protein
VEFFRLGLMKKTDTILKKHRFFASTKKFFFGCKIEIFSVNGQKRGNIYKWRAF